MTVLMMSTARRRVNNRIIASCNFCGFDGLVRLRSDASDLSPQCRQALLQPTAGRPHGCTNGDSNTSSSLNPASRSAPTSSLVLARR